MTKMDETKRKNTDEVAAIRSMISPPGLVPEFPPNLTKARAGHDGMARIFPVLEGTTFVPVSLGGVSGEKLIPPNLTSTKVILYLHGWGFALGSIASHRHLVAQIAQASGATAFSLDYRLAPEAPFPAGLQDGIAAYKALLALGHTPEDIVIAGDSSGGGLALSIAIALKEQGLPQPSGLFLMSPWIDLSLAGPSILANADADFMCNRAELAHWAQLYAGEAGIANPLVSPILSDLRGLAPILIHAGSQEILLSDALELAMRAGLANTSVKLLIGADMPHTWHYLWPFLTAARDAIAQAGQWISNRG